MGQVIPIEKIMEYRDKNCYCAECNEPESCDKCGQELPFKETKCLTCQVIDSLLEYIKK